MKQTKQATLHLSSQLMRDKKKNWSTFKSNLTPHSTEVYCKKRIKNGDHHHPDEDAMRLVGFPNLLPSLIVIAAVLCDSLEFGLWNKRKIPHFGPAYFFYDTGTRNKITWISLLLIRAMNNPFALPASHVE